MYGTYDAPIRRILLGGDVVGKRDGDEGATVQPPFIPVEEFQVGGEELYQTLSVACDHQTARSEREREKEGGGD